jgi:hypothetical protein
VQPHTHGKPSGALDPAAGSVQVRRAGAAGRGADLRELQQPGHGLGGLRQLGLGGSADTPSPLHARRRSRPSRTRRGSATAARAPVAACSAGSSSTSLSGARGSGSTAARAVPPLNPCLWPGRFHAATPVPAGPGRLGPL